MSAIVNYSYKFMYWSIYPLGVLNQDKHLDLGGRILPGKINAPYYLVRNVVVHDGCGLTHRLG